MNTKCWWSGCSVLLQLILPIGSLYAQNGLISGVVRSDGRAIADARVRALTGTVSRTQVATDEGGRYRLSVPVGTYTIAVRFPGYAEGRVDSVRVSAGAEVTADVQLVPATVSLDAVMVTAGRREETVNDVPASVAIVDARQVRERVGLTPLDFAVATPGVDVAVQGLQGRQLVARGFNSTLSASLLLLTDFRNSSLPSPRANLSYFMSQTSDDIERVEIVRGPASALYGPNAADGVVHFITKSPFDAPGGSLSLTGGGRSLFDGAARFAGRVNDRFAVKASGSYFKGREWPAQKNPAETIARDPFTERASAELRADYRLSGSALAILTLGTADAVNVVDYTAIGAYAVQKWRTDFAQLRVSDGKFFAQVHWRGNPGTGTSTSLTQGAVTLDHTNIFTAQVQHGLDFGSRTTVQYGADLQRTDPQTLGTISGRFEDSDRSLEVGVFAQASTRLTPTLRLLTAARIDRHDRLDGAVFSPRVGFTYSPRQGQTLRASYNRAFSTPSSLQLFADILAARLDPLPFSLRAVGVPKGGFRFAKDCGGLCIASPFAPGQQLPLDATLLWPAVVQIMKAAGVDLSAIPAPGRSDIATAVRMLDLSAGAFRTVPSDVSNLPSLKPTITNSFEVGYRGLVGDRVIVDVSGYATRRQNFISPLSVVTPNVFLSTQSLATFLGRFMSAEQAGALAAGIGGVDGNALAPGIPLGTVGPTGRLAGTDILLSYQNVGDVRLWGSDLSVEVAATDNFTVSGNYSWVSKNLFEGQGIGGSDLSTNAPRHKAFVSARYRLPARDFAVEFRARSVGAFRMIDGVLVGDVQRFTVADVEAGVAIPGATRARLTATVQNIADKRHAEFFGHPMLGRLVMTRLQYRF